MQPKLSADTIPEYDTIIVDRYIGLILYREEEANLLCCFSRVDSFHCLYNVWK